MIILSKKLKKSNKNRKSIKKINNLFKGSSYRKNIFNNNNVRVSLKNAVNNILIKLKNTMDSRTTEEKDKDKQNKNFMKNFNKLKKLLRNLEISYSQFLKENYLYHKDYIKILKNIYKYSTTILKYYDDTDILYSNNL